MLAEVTYHGCQRVARHLHAHARFVLVLRGAVTEIRGDASQTYRSPALLFRRADEPHAYLVDWAGATCLVVDLDPAWYARAREHAPVLEQSAAFDGGFVVHLAHRLHGEFLLRDEVSRLAIESLVLGLVAEASRRVGAARRLVGACVADAGAHAGRAAVRAAAAVDDGRRACGGAPVHLARTFRRCYQTTFGAYVRQVRIEFARRELAVSAASLSEIAAAAGFCDQSHFSRLFKQYTGLTPAEYRVALHAR